MQGYTTPANDPSFPPLMLFHINLMVYKFGQTWYDRVVERTMTAQNTQLCNQVYADKHRLQFYFLAGFPFSFLKLVLKPPYQGYHKLRYCGASLYRLFRRENILNMAQNGVLVIFSRL